MIDIVPSRQALSEALHLAEETLKNIELGELELSSIALKSSRLARLLNDFDYQEIFEYEASGYPVTPGGVEPRVWQLAVIAGRRYTNKLKGETKDHIYVSPIAELESELETAKIGIEAAKDANISVSSANPNQFLHAPSGNTLERGSLRSQAEISARRLAARRGLIHKYVNQKYYELKFSGIAEDIFSRLRERVDLSISTFIPDETKRLTAIYDNLASENSEDWSNAVHSCRRLLQALADKLFPPTTDTIKTVGKKEIVIKMGPDNYINRLIGYIDSKNQSGRFKALVGSDLNFIGDRLDSAFQAAQKGSHSDIIDRNEADRYVVNTYIIVGDVLSL